MAVGELEVVRMREPREGENMPRGGNKGFNGPCPHGCGVVPSPNGVVPVAGGGQNPFGV